jgi:hypothetical protein
MLLDREEIFHSSCLKTLDGLGVQIREGRKLTIRCFVVRKGSRALHFAGKTSILAGLVAATLHLTLVVLNVTPTLV